MLRASTPEEEMEGYEEMGEYGVISSGYMGREKERKYYQNKYKN